MKLTERIESFAELGDILGKAANGSETKYSNRLSGLVQQQQIKNSWFTPENVVNSITAIADELTFDNLTKWTAAYPALSEECKPATIAVVMAGNMPLVGFHDLLSVLISGNRILAKPASGDPDLIRFVGDILTDINPGFNGKIAFTDGTLSGFDAVIATGSNNSSRYFEYYFSKYPSLIRKNRNSIAILEGTESASELEALGSDIFSYFGLGCRNVSKLLVPAGYDFIFLIENLKKFSAIVNHNKYANNYDFSKAVYLVNREKFLDTGYLLLKQDKNLVSPVAVLYYENYSRPEETAKYAEEYRNEIQCIIGKNHIPFGKSQNPSLWDYADGVDTLEFLLKKNY